MTICSARYLVYEARRLMGSVLARCRLHRVRMTQIDGDDVVIKTRHFGSELAIWVGNLYLFLQRSDVAVLSSKSWIRWECAIEAATKPDGLRRTDVSIGKHPGVLITRFVPGRTLRDILKDSRSHMDQKFAAIEWALEALYRLHTIRADWGSGLEQSVSHGDATVDNVIIRVELQSAQWIDFDIRHLPSLSEADRQSDDLRSLISSTAVILPVTCYQRLADMAVASMSDRFLMDRFRKRLISDWIRPTTFHLAQAPLSWTAANALSRSLLDSLN